MSAKYLVSLAIPSIAAWLILLQIPLVGSYQHSYVPKDGFVPNEKTAVRIAEAVLTPIFGEAKVDSEKPFSAKLDEKEDYWTVSGHLAEQFNKGGVAIVLIARSDGHILRVSHGK